MGPVYSLLTLLLVLSIYFSIKKNDFASSITLSLGILVKPQALTLAPVFILSFLKNFSPKRLVQLVIPGVIILFLIAYPFFPHNSLGGLIEKINSTTNEYKYTSLSAYNIWQLAGDWQSDQTKLFFLPYQVWGLLLYLIYGILISYFYFKRRLSLYTLSALFLLSFYFLMIRIHERYMYPALVFLIIVVFQTKNKALLFFTGVLHAIFFLDLIYVYFKYNGMPVEFNLITSPLYNFLSLHAKLITIVAMIVFIATTYLLLKQDYETSG